LEEKGSFEIRKLGRWGGQRIRGLGDKETGRQGEMERKFVQRSPRFFCDFSGFSVE